MNEMRRDYHTRLRRFHEAKWDEELIFELCVPGQRGVIVPQPCEEIEKEAGDVISALPDSLKRKKAPFLPEVHQMRVNRHFMRLSQETLGRRCYAGYQSGDLYHEVQSESAGASGFKESQCG